jgi:hypothetical protein
MFGQLCTIGSLPNLARVFYYSVAYGLHIEIIDRRNRDTRHLVLLVDSEGVPIPIPKGARFVHVGSETGADILDNHVRSLDRKHRQEA